LGATAAQALLGRQFRVTAQRGKFVESALAPLVTATVHPSSILRARDDETRHEEMRRFVEDLKKVAKALWGRLQPARDFRGTCRIVAGPQDGRFRAATVRKRGAWHEKHPASLRSRLGNVTVATYYHVLYMSEPDIVISSSELISFARQLLEA